jgi:hypothetical protein
VISKTPNGAISTSLKDPNVTFDLLNPNTDEVLGTSKFADAYVLLYSIYRYLGDKRDDRDAKLKLLATAKSEFDVASADYAVALKAYNTALALSTASPDDGTLQTDTATKLATKNTKQGNLTTATATLSSAQAAYDLAQSFLV